MMVVLKEINFLKGEYSDREIIDMLNEHEIKIMLKAAKINSVGQWKAVGKEIQSILKKQNMTIVDVEDVFLKRR